MPKTDEMDRRGFFAGAIYLMGAAITAALSLPALAYLFVPPKVRKSDEWIDLGDVSRLTPKVPVEMTFRRNRVDGWKVISETGKAWVVKQDDNNLVAYGPECTHLGCAYHWDESKSEFICPCHNSLFSIDGTVTAGPAPRPLDRYETKLDGKKLLIGKLNTSEQRS